MTTGGDVVLDRGRESAAWLALAAGIGMLAVLVLGSILVGPVDMLPGMQYYDTQFSTIVQQVTVLMLTDALMLVFLVGLAHAASAVVRGPCVLRSAAVAMSAMTVAVAATMQNVYLLPMGSVGTPAGASGGPDIGVVSMLRDAQGWCFGPTMAPLIGATLVVFAVLLRRSDLPGARGLGLAYAGVGVLGVAVLPTASAPSVYMWWWPVLVVPALVVTTLVWLALWLRASRRAATRRVGAAPLAANEVSLA